VKKSWAFLLLLSLFGAAQIVRAQEQASKLEAYGGYYYVRFNVNASAAGGGPAETFNGNGGGVQLAYNPNNRLWRDGHYKRYVGRRRVYLSCWAQGQFQAWQSHAFCSDTVRRHLVNRRDWQFGVRK
jgi:hypothetical protein